SEVLRTTSPIADLSWSTTGDYLVATTDLPDVGLVVVERATRRTATIPRPAAALSIRFVAMPGGRALPADGIVAADPAPTPTPEPAAENVACVAGLLSAWVAVEGGQEIAHAQHLVRTADGGMRVVATMPALDL